MATSLSNIVNNLSAGIHKAKCKYGHDDEKCETCENTYKISHCFFEYTNFKNDLIEYKCLCCKTNHQKRLDEKLKKRFIYIYIYIYIYEFLYNKLHTIIVAKRRLS